MEKIYSQIEQVNKQWTDCKIGDDERLDNIEKIIPDKFKKIEFYNQVSEAKSEMTKTKTNIFGEPKKEVQLSKDPSTKSEPTIELSQNIPQKK